MFVLGGHAQGVHRSAFELCFLVGAGAALAGALVTLLVPRRQTSQGHAQEGQSLARA